MMFLIAVDIDDLVAGQEVDNSQVTFDVYKMYISNAGGYCIVSLIFLMFATSIGIQTSATWWLAYWLEQRDGVSVPFTSVEMFLSF